MRITKQVRQILSHYEGESPGVLQNLARILMHGSLQGTGKLLILAVDQGFEHGPRTFVMNPEAFDPNYHHAFAKEAKVSAYAAPLGLLQASSHQHLGTVPTILKINSGNSLHGKNKSPDQAMTASVTDALRLGCVGIGFTLYPGSDQSIDMIEELQQISQEARSYGLMVMVWSYPRGEGLSKSGETSLDTIAYGAHLACLLGAHIVKVKLPSGGPIENEHARPLYTAHVSVDSLSQRVSHVVDACFSGKRLVIFSGGESKETEILLEEVRGIRQGRGAGSIIGRNFFQKPWKDALALVENLTNILKH